VWSANPSYRAVIDNPKKRNCCWLSAGLETLYAIFSPLWLRGISGHGKDLFTCVAQHFSNQSTAELNSSNSIRSTLTRGENKIFEVASTQYPGSFIPGAFSSCDFFIEASVDPTLHKRKEYKQLFSVDETRIFTCEANRDRIQVLPNRANQTIHVLNVKPQMFHESGIPYSNVTKLIETWFSSGLIGVSGLVCRDCTGPKLK